MEEGKQDKLRKLLGDAEECLRRTIVSPAKRIIPELKIKELGDPATNKISIAVNTDIEIYRNRSRDVSDGIQQLKYAQRFIEFDEPAKLALGAERDKLQRRMSELGLIENGLRGIKRAREMRARRESTSFMATTSSGLTIPDIARLTLGESRVSSGGASEDPDEIKRPYPVVPRPTIGEKIPRILIDTGDSIAQAPDIPNDNLIERHYLYFDAAYSSDDININFMFDQPPQEYTCEYQEACTVYRNVFWEYLERYKDYDGKDQEYYVYMKVAFINEAREPANPPANVRSKIYRFKFKPFCEFLVRKALDSRSVMGHNINLGSSKCPTCWKAGKLCLHRLDLIAHVLNETPVSEESLARLSLAAVKTKCANDRVSLSAQFAPHRGLDADTIREHPFESVATLICAELRYLTQEKYWCAQIANANKDRAPTDPSCEYPVALAATVLLKSMHGQVYETLDAFVIHANVKVDNINKSGDPSPAAERYRDAAGKLEIHANVLAARFVAYEILKRMDLTVEEAAALKAGNVPQLSKDMEAALTDIYKILQPVVREVVFKLWFAGEKIPMPEAKQDDPNVKIDAKPAHGTVMFF